MNIWVSAYEIKCVCIYAENSKWKVYWLYTYFWRWWHFCSFFYKSYNQGECFPDREAVSFMRSDLPEFGLLSWN